MKGIVIFIILFISTHDSYAQNITKLSSQQINSIEANKKSYLRLYNRDLSDDRFYIPFEEQIMLPLVNGLISQIDVIEIFNKISDTQKKKSFLNHLYYDYNNSLSGYDSIQNHILDYMKQDNELNDEYCDVIRLKLLKGSNLKILQDSYYSKFVSKTISTKGNYTSLLEALALNYQEEKMEKLLKELSNDSSLKLISSSNIDVFKILYNRQFKKRN